MTSQECQGAPSTRLELWVASCVQRAILEHTVRQVRTFGLFVVAESHAVLQHPHLFCTCCVCFYRRGCPCGLPVNVLLPCRGFRCGCAATRVYAGLLLLRFVVHSHALSCWGLLPAGVGSPGLVCRWDIQPKHWKL
jgi:hypothetical protein